MINHFFASLYNFADLTTSGVMIPAGLPVVIPDVVSSGLLPIRGITSETAEEFALHATKVVDSSTYRACLFDYDSRLTFDPTTVGADIINSLEFLTSLKSVNPAMLSYIFIDQPDLQKTWHRSTVLEAAAAVLVGAVAAIAKENGFERVR